jgi:hypothetical protein
MKENKKFEIKTGKCKRKNYSNRQAMGGYVLLLSLW